MKRRSLFLAVCSALVIMLAGCSKQDAQSSGSSADPTASVAVSDIVNDSPQISAASPISYNTQGSESGMITEEEAKRSALNHAGFSEDDASFTKVRLEYDDGAAEYDIEFTADAKHYEYEISAADGTVLEFSYEPISEPTGLLSEIKVKEIAADSAGFSGEQVTFTKFKLDVENGVTVYEVEFTANGVEYEFEIDAKTGSVLKSEIDYD